MSDATKTNAERADELQDILCQMKDLLWEARKLVRGTPEESRANAYWIAHISMALDSEHGYLGGSMCTMESTANDLRESDG